MGGGGRGEGGGGLVKGAVGRVHDKHKRRASPSVPMISILFFFCVFLLLPRTRKDHTALVENLDCVSECSAAIIS